MDLKASKAMQGHSDLASVRLEIKNLCYSVKQRSKGFRKRSLKSAPPLPILQNITCTVEPGILTAVMGASGAGKSSMLNVLAQRIREYSGEVLIDGTPASCLSNFNAMACYIQQNEFFFGTLTVREHLLQQAALRLAMAPADRAARVDEVLQQFSLSHIQNSRIGNVSMGASRGISGGEKKRLSIATELLTNPSLIFADEPTSGLDSFMAEQVIDHLHSLAKRGHTIVCTIHQPSSDAFQRFDKLILLAQGHLMYAGPPMGGIPYFARLGYSCPPLTEPSLFYLETLAFPKLDANARKAKIQELASHFEKVKETYLQEWDTTLKHLFEETFQIKKKASISSGSEDKKEFTPRRSTHLAIPRNQAGLLLRPKTSTMILTLLRRNCLIAFRDPSIMRGRLIQVLCLSVIFGIVFWRQKDYNYYNKAGSSFFLALGMTFMVLMSTFTTYAQEKLVANKEIAANLYSGSTFLLNKMLTDLIFQLYPGIIWVGISWYMIGLDDRVTSFLAAEGILILNSLCISGLAYFLATACNSLPVTLAVGPTVLIPFMTLSGFLIQESAMKPFWQVFYYLSPFHYVFSFNMRLILLDRVFTNEDGSELLGNSILKEFQVTTESWDFATDCAALIAWAIVTRILALVLLHLRIRFRKF